MEDYKQKNKNNEYNKSILIKLPEESDLSKLLDIKIEVKNINNKTINTSQGKKIIIKSKIYTTVIYENGQNSEIRYFKNVTPFFEFIPYDNRIKKISVHASNICESKIIRNNIFINTIIEINCYDSFNDFINLEYNYIGTNEVKVNNYRNIGEKLIILLMLLIKNYRLWIFSK